ncbi:MAG TPA: pentapeptide repeat-containing protein [Pyrinomonadaceae bacterium]|nr:pentapeptide repeat-containing protein [Pyrinomonadaceae bacterium]
MFKTILIITALITLGSGTSNIGAAQTTENQSEASKSTKPETARTSERQSASPSPENPEQTKLNMQKLQVEIDKLKEEAAGLRTTNETLGWWTKILTAWLAAVGSIIAAGIIAYVGRSLNRTQRGKLEQDKALEKEKHILEVFQNLGDEKDRVRIGAVAILVQRLLKIQEAENASTEDKHELPTIVSVLISASKHEEKVEIQKYIADGLAKSLGAFVPDGQSTPQNGESPLKQYDFQGAKLENAWWRRIDAREVDFYGAHLARAGLREAFLSGTILKNANLSSTTLIQADLTNANLQGADLTGARLNKAKLKGADLRKANLQHADLSDTNLAEAKLDGAKLYEANLTGAIITDQQKTVANFDAE